MTITEYFQLYNSPNKKSLLNYHISMETDSACKFSELYDKCISQHTDRITSHIIEWHNMFMRYVDLPDAVFWVRRYESSSKSDKKLHAGRWVTRRACKTEYDDGFSYVFVSNFDVHEIFNMIRLGVKPDEHEFLKLMKNHKYPLHYDDGGSCEESDIAVYPKIGSPRAGVLTANHWYLAHILGVNDAIDYCYPIDFDAICPRGDMTDWNDSKGYMVRQIKKTLSDTEKALVKAHFLRFVDPLNYYIVPGRHHQDNHAYHYKNNQIGEYAPLNNYMSLKFANIYGKKVVEEFRQIVLAKPLPSAVADEYIDIYYSSAPLTGTSAYSDDEKLELAAYFLKHKTGLNLAEKTILNRDSHGSIARDILIELGIDTSRKNSQKGLLINSNIDDEISKATGLFKSTLEKIKKQGL